VYFSLDCKVLIGYRLYTFNFALLEDKKNEMKGMRTHAIVASCREEAMFACKHWKIYEEPLAKPSCPRRYVFKLCTSLLRVRTVTVRMHILDRTVL